jgi:hypothetical protein
VNISGNTPDTYWIIWVINVSSSREKYKITPVPFTGQNPFMALPYSGVFFATLMISPLIICYSIH